MDGNTFLSKYGPWALVTGASSGIGLALAARLAERGLSIVLVARRHATLEQHAHDLMNRFGAKTRIVSSDLATDGSVDRIVSATSDLDIACSLGRRDSAPQANLWTTTSARSSA